MELFNCIGCERMLPHICGESFNEKEPDKECAGYSTESINHKKHLEAFDSGNDERNRERIRQVMDITQKPERLVIEALVNANWEMADAIESVLKIEQIPIDAEEGGSGISSIILSSDSDVDNVSDYNNLASDVDVDIGWVDEDWEVQYRSGDVTNVETSIAHCVSRDLYMGAGVAKQIREKFGRIEELKEQEIGVGGVAVLSIGPGRFIYNLVTKEKFSDKPSLWSIRESIKEMRTHSIENNIDIISMPRIASGLDKMDWNEVLKILNKLFKSSDIIIRVYTLDDGKDSQNWGEPDEKDILQSINL